MENEIKRIMEEENRKRLKSREIKEKIGEANVRWQEKIEDRLVKLNEYSKKVQENRLKQREKDISRQKSLEEKYNNKMELLDLRLKKMQKDGEEKFKNSKSKEGILQSKISSIRDNKSQFDKEEEDRRVETLKEIQHLSELKSLKKQEAVRKIAKAMQERNMKVKQKGDEVRKAKIEKEIEATNQYRRSQDQLLLSFVFFNPILIFL